MATINQRWMFLALGIGVSMVFIDISIIPVAIPTIRNEFQLSGTMGDWIINAYTLTLTILSIPGLRIANMLGARNAFLLGIGIFVFASGVGGFGESGASLIASRTILGIGGALILPAAQSILMMHFPVEKWGKILATYSTMGSIFLVFGPFIGGMLTNFWTWRGIFWINFPVAVMGVSAITQLVPQCPRKQMSFDILGFLWLSSAILCLTLGIMQGDPWEWTSWPVLALLSLGVILLALAYIVLKRIPIPIIDLSLLKSRHFFADIGCIVIGQMLFISPLFWSMYFQTDLFYLPFKAGLLTFIATSLLVVAGPLVRKFVIRWGSRIPIIMGFCLLLFCISWMLAYTKNVNAYLFLPAIIPFGLGIRLVLAPSFTQWMNALPVEKSASVSEIHSTFRQFASTISLGIYGIIFFSSKHHFTAINSLSLGLASCGLLIALFMSSDTYRFQIKS